MGKNRDITVAVHGIRYEEFASLKWRQFLRWFSLLLAAVLLALLIAAWRGAVSLEIPAAGSLLAVFAVAAVLAVYRSGIRKTYRASGLSDMELTYVFDRDGWTVRRRKEQVRVLWSKTWRVRRDRRALMLYPNRKSVNLVPLRDITEPQMEQILRWVRGT